MWRFHRATTSDIQPAIQWTTQRLMIVKIFGTERLIVCKLRLRLDRIVVIVFEKTEMKDDFTLSLVGCDPCNVYCLCRLCRLLLPWGWHCHDLDALLSIGMTVCPTSYWALHAAYTPMILYNLANTLFITAPLVSCITLLLVVNNLGHSVTVWSRESGLLGNPEHSHLYLVWHKQQCV